MEIIISFITKKRKEKAGVITTVIIKFYCFISKRVFNPLVSFSE